MDEQERQEFNLDDIIKEFSDYPEEDRDLAEYLDVKKSEPEEKIPVTTDTVRLDGIPTEEKKELTGDTIRMDAVSADTIRMEPVSGDTIRMEPVSADTIRMEPVTGDTIRMDAIGTEEEPVDGEEAVEIPAPKEEKAFTEGWEPEYEQPIGEYVPPQPIVFHPRSRLRELKRKLVAGPEKRYYELTEKGLGKLQAAIFLSFLVVLISAGATAMYALGMVQENRLRLMVFGQMFAMLVSALLGSYQLIEGVEDMKSKRFSLNSLLVFAFAVCCVDAVLCLKQLRVPCCAAFSLEVTMSLWSAYQRRNTEKEQMDTMRKASHLDSLCPVEDYYEGRKGFLKGEGQVEDFMDHYQQPSTQENILSIYAISALAVSFLIGIVGGIRHGILVGVQVLAVSLLAAMPATMFITLSRPKALLERRLHALGVVICGWKGVKGLCGKEVFPVTHDDLFPDGAVRLNGMKFYGSRNPDEVVALATAVIAADGGGLAPLFNQLLDSRNGRHYDAEDLHDYGNGIGARVGDEVVLVGPLSFLKEMKVDVPEGSKVSQAVCVAVGGELSALFAVTYDKVKPSIAGMRTLCAYRNLNPILLTGDFTLTPGFIRSKFGVNPKKLVFPEREDRDEIRSWTPEEDETPALLVTSKGLAPFAYGVTGARALRTASILGTIIHMTGGILGLAIMLVLTILGALELLTPANMFLYQLIWMIPGLLVTEWTRDI